MHRALMLAQIPLFRLELENRGSTSDTIKDTVIIYRNILFGNYLDYLLSYHPTCEGGNIM